MIFSTVAGVLLLSFCFATSHSSEKECNEGSSSPIAEEFYKAVKSQPSLDVVFDINLPAEDYYKASLKDFTDLGVKDPQKLAASVKDIVEKVFPDINRDINKRVITNNIADFLTKQNKVSKGNLNNLVTMYTNFLQKGADEANGDPKYIARNGFHGLMNFLLTSGAMNGDNIGEFFHPVFKSYHDALACQDSN